MKLMNFRRLDPMYTAGGKKGLTQGAKGDEAVWTEFSPDPARCFATADLILASLDDPEVDVSRLDEELDDGVTEGPEGRLLTRKHLARERNRKIVEAKRKQALQKHGKLVCEACGFNFKTRYGERGHGYIECHHTKPLMSLAEGAKTHIDDLALVCANCHRIIHRRRQWLSITELKALLA